MKVEHSYTKNENGLKQPTEDTGQWKTHTHTHTHR